MSWGQADSERRLANVVRVATITRVDPAKGRAKVSFGGEGESAWLPFPSARAGQVQVWSPPSEGEQVIVASPSGDTAQGLIVASYPSQHAPAPSGDSGVYVINIGECRIEATADGITLSVGEVSMSITGGGVSMKNGSVDHNGKNIGHDHVHGGVSQGGSTTQGPQ